MFSRWHLLPLSSRAELTRVSIDFAGQLTSTRQLNMSGLPARWPAIGSGKIYFAFAFSINAISLVSASRKRVRMAISKLILARDRRRSRLVPKKNSIWTLRRQSAMVSMLCPHLYSPWLEDSTSAKICDVKPVETGERNERLRREKTFFMLATSEE